MKAVVTPDQLLDHLVGEQELATYKKSGQFFFGSGDNWHHADIQRVVIAALSSAARQVDGIRVTLDAFVVRADTKRPARRHFLGKPYSEIDWISRFDGWRLCSHRPEDIVGGARSANLVDVGAGLNERLSAVLGTQTESQKTVEADVQQPAQ